jgi:hypothetical protein
MLCFDRTLTDSPTVLLYNDRICQQILFDFLQLSVRPSLHSPIPVVRHDRLDKIEPEAAVAVAAHEF